MRKEKKGLLMVAEDDLDDDDDDDDDDGDEVGDDEELGVRGLFRGCHKEKRKRIRSVWFHEGKDAEPRVR